MIPDTPAAKVIRRKGAARWFLRENALVLIFGGIARSNCTWVVYTL
jgi:hypothetical protein